MRVITFYLLKTRLTDEVPSNVHFVTDCSKLDEKLEEQIRTFVDEHMDTVLIIIDTFQLIRSANKDSGYSNDYLEVQKLKKLADELKIAILLVHHLRKQGDSDPINEISGTNGIAGCADALFVLKKSKGDNMLIIKSLIKSLIKSTEKG